MPLRVLRVVCIMRPRIYPRRVRMTVQFEYLSLAFPHCFAPEHLFDGHAFDVVGLNAMQTPNHVPQFVQVRGHAAASIKSPTLQKSRSTPAAIAGVQRNVL